MLLEVTSRYMSVGEPDYLVTLITQVTLVTVAALVILVSLVTLVILSTLVTLFRSSNQLKGQV